MCWGSSIDHLLQTGVQTRLFGRTIWHWISGEITVGFDSDVLGLFPPVHCCGQLLHLFGIFDILPICARGFRNICRCRWTSSSVVFGQCHSCLDFFVCVGLLPPGQLDWRVAEAVSWVVPCRMGTVSDQRFLFPRCWRHVHQRWLVRSGVVLAVWQIGVTGLFLVLVSTGLLCNFLIVVQEGPERLGCWVVP